MDQHERMETIFWLNVLEILGIVLLLALALIFEFFLGETPCPLCLLQRAGFLMMSLGLLCNIRYGISPRHYAFTLLAALLTSFIALRQIALHIVPGDPGFGSKILGPHMYTWSFIMCMAFVAYTAVILGLENTYRSSQTKWDPMNGSRHPKTFYCLFALILLLTVTNLISVLLTCGLATCSDDPKKIVETGYNVLKT